MAEMNFLVYVTIAFINWQAGALISVLTELPGYCSKEGKSRGVCYPVKFNLLYCCNPVLPVWQSGHPLN